VKEEKSPSGRRIPRPLKSGGTTQGELFTQHKMRREGNDSISINGGWGKFGPHSAVMLGRKSNSFFRTIPLKGEATKSALNRSAGPGGCSREKRDLQESWNPTKKKIRRMLGKRLEESKGKKERSTSLLGTPQR